MKKLQRLEIANEEAERRISELHSECDGYMSKATAWKMHADRLEEEFETLTMAVGQGLVTGNMDRLQKALDAAMKIVKAKETKP